MSIFHFVRDTGARTYNRTRTARGIEIAPHQQIKFDSSPARSICMTYGWTEDLFELKEERQEHGRTVWDVYAGNKHIDKKNRKVGVLTYTPPTF